MFISSFDAVKHPRNRRAEELDIDILEEAARDEMHLGRQEEEEEEEDDDIEVIEEVADLDASADEEDDD